MEFTTGWFDGGFSDEYERHIGPFRWRGHINWKDVVERAIGGSFAGLFAGTIFWALTRLVG